MRNHKVGIRYATALFELVKEQNLVDKAYSDLTMIFNVHRESRELRRMLSSPIVSPVKKQQVIRALFEGQVCKTVLEFMLILTSCGREMHIGSIAEDFIQLYKDHNGIKVAYLTTAIPADDKTKARVIEILHAHTGKDIELIEKVNPNIIGGFVLTFDDYQIDSSLSNKLNELRKEYSENIYIKEF